MYNQETGGIFCLLIIYSVVLIFNWLRFLCLMKTDNEILY